MEKNIIKMYEELEKQFETVKDSKVGYYDFMKQHNDFREVCLDRRHEIGLLFWENEDVEEDISVKERNDRFRKFIITNGHYKELTDISIKLSNTNTMDSFLSMNYL